jgi:hypothetical protein
MNLQTNKEQRYGNKKDNKSGFGILDVVNDRHRFPASHLLPGDIDPHQSQRLEASAS